MSDYWMGEHKERKDCPDCYWRTDFCHKQSKCLNCGLPVELFQSKKSERLAYFSEQYIIARLPQADCWTYVIVHHDQPIKLNTLN